MTARLAPSAPLPRAVPWGALALGVMLLGGGPLFWPGLLSLGRAWSTPEYSHGPLIPLISAWLFLRGLRDDPAPQPGSRWPGVLVVAGALALAALGHLVRIDDVVTYAFILWLGGAVLVSMGFARGRRHLLAVFHLIFMLPLPQFVFWKLTIFLQLTSSQIGVWVISTMGIPVFLDGNIIDLGVYKLQVAEACSGLRYLFPILSFSYLFGILYRGPFWHKAVLFLTAAPLTVLMNAFRIGMIGVLVDRYGIAQAEGFLHVFEGWVIFGACIAILFLMALGLQRLAPNRGRGVALLDLETDGLLPPLMRVVSLPASPALWAAAALSLALGLAALAAPRMMAAQSEAVTRTPFALFPETLGDWSSFSLPLEPEIERVLAASDHLNRIYAQPGQPTVGLFVAWYARQTEGAGLHSPEVCLPTSGWEIVALSPQAVTVGGESFTLNRAVIQKGLERQLVYYWSEQRGRRMADDWAAKLALLSDGITKGRSDGALVRLVTPIPTGEEEATADARLQGFLPLILPKLAEYVPG